MIFERLRRLRAVDSNMKGSGIGLSLCRDIGLHTANLGREPSGRGAAFTVKLCSAMPISAWSRSILGGRAGDGDRRNDHMVSDFTPVDSQRRVDVTPPKDARKILLVEDNRELRIFMYNSLIDTYHVVEADDGVEASKRFAAIRHRSSPT